MATSGRSQLLHRRTTQRKGQRLLALLASWNLAGIIMLLYTVTPLAILLELVLLALAIVLALVGAALHSGWAPRMFPELVVWFDAVARRWWWALLVVGGVAVVACALFTLVGGVPVPLIHDEFSYLLAADTFASGRLTNPPHPMWKHFESFHIIHQPTYASKYPPAQGLFLALGQVLTGLPIVGVWISYALGCMALCWMLQAWLPPRWALLGGLLVAWHPSLIFFWGNGYMGGAIPMLGGALLLGATRRLLSLSIFGLRNTNRAVSVSDDPLVTRGAVADASGSDGPSHKPQWKRPILALLLGLALVLLACSRPFEGLVLSVPVFVLLLWWLVTSRTLSFGATLVQVFLPVGAVGLLGLVGLGVYNAHVTGSPFRLPYQIHEETYGVAPIFVFQSPRSVPEYRHEAIRAFQTGWSLDYHRSQQTVSGALYVALSRCVGLWSYYVHPVLTLFPLALVLTWGCFCLGIRSHHLPRANPVSHRRWFQFALLCGLLGILAFFLITWTNPTYIAPVLCVAILLLIQGLRYLRVWRPGNRAFGQRLVRWLLLFYPLALIPSLMQYTFMDAWSRQRARVQARLKATPGKHLVIVRYRKGHPPTAEWVYNRADIDASRVVWAREMSPEENAHLLDYFGNRKAWLLEVGTRRPRPQPYPRPFEARDDSTLSR